MSAIGPGDAGVGRPFGQPALVSDHAPLRGHGPTGFDQAQGRRDWSSRELRIMRDMRRQRATRKEIGSRLGRSELAVKAQIGRFRETMTKPANCCPTCGRRR